MRKGNIVLAIFLILMGVYLLLNELDIGIPGWDKVWPVFPFAGGLVLIGSYIFGERRNPDRVFFGTAATLVGLAFFFVTFGPLEYRDLGDWWTIFVIIGGIAFLAQWAAARFRDWGALFLAMVAFVVGFAGLAIKLEWLGPETRALLPNLWPALLVLGGLILFLRGLFGRRS